MDLTKQLLCCIRNKKKFEKSFSTTISQIDHNSTVRARREKNSTMRNAEINL